MNPAMLLGPSGRRYRLYGTSTLIGSQGCAILLSGPGIAAQHARLVPGQTGYAIEPIGGQVAVDGRIVSGLTDLADQAQIAIGNITLTYTSSNGVGAPAVVPSIGLPVVAPIVVVPPTHQGLLGQNAISSGGTTNKQSPIVGRNSSNGGPTLVGRVIYIDGPHSESPDIDAAGLIIRGTLGLVVLPFICWQPALVIPFFLYGLGQQNRQVQVRYLRVEDSVGGQHVVKMKGDPIRGMVSQGDEVSFWGMSKGGNLNMDRARNHVTNSDVILRPVVQRRTSRIVVLLVASISLLCILSFVLSSFPSR